MVHHAGRDTDHRVRVLARPFPLWPHSPRGGRGSTRVLHDQLAHDVVRGRHGSGAAVLRHHRAAHPLRAVPGALRARHGGGVCPRGDQFQLGPAGVVDLRDHRAGNCLLCLPQETARAHRHTNPLHLPSRSLGACRRVARRPAGNLRDRDRFRRLPRARGVSGRGWHREPSRGAAQQRRAPIRRLCRALPCVPGTAQRRSEPRHGAFIQPRDGHRRTDDDLHPPRGADAFPDERGRRLDRRLSLHLRASELRDLPVLR